MTGSVVFYWHYHGYLWLCCAADIPVWLCMINSLLYSEYTNMESLSFSCHVEPV